MMLLVVLVPFIIGYVILLRLCARREPLHLPLDLFLAFGLGAGVVSQLVFYQVIFFNGLSIGLVRFSALAVLLASIVMLFVVKRHCLSEVAPWRETTLFLCLVCIVLYAGCVVNLNMPFGDWDAWSLWNFRANAIFRSGPEWWSIFHHEVQGKHPWLLPFLVDWGWALNGQETPVVPILWTLAMSVGVAGVLVFGLARFLRFPFAILGGLFLMSIPFFLYHSFAQYADIFSAYYFLAAVVSLAIYQTFDEKKYLMLGGAFLALLAFSKDEGILLAVLTILFMFARGMFRSPARGFWVAFLIFSIPTVMCEVLMRTQFIPSVVVAATYYGFDGKLFWHPERWVALGRFLLKGIVLNPDSGNFWPIFLLAGFFHTSDRARRITTWVGCVIGLFIIIFAVLYLISTTPLLWRLSVTVNRLAYQIMPAGVFYIFLCLFGRDAARVSAEDCSSCQ